MMDNENSKLGQHYKDSFSDFRTEPSQAVWENLMQHPALKVTPKPSFFSPAKMIISAAAFTTVAVVLYFALQKEVLNKPIQSRTSQATLTAAHPEALPIVKGEADKTKEIPSTANTVMPEKTRNQSVNTIVLTSPKAPLTPAEKPLVIPAKPLPAAASAFSTAQNIQLANTPIQHEATVTPEPVPANHFKGTPVEISPNHMICKGESTTIWATGGESYLWNNGETQSSQLVSPAMTTTYSVSITDASGAVTSANITVNVSICQDLYVPNAFTPDGDSHNDEFIAAGENISQFKMVIFARNGQMIFESNDILKGWNGEIKGKMGDPGVYIYKINNTNAAGESKEKTGPVNLIR